MPAAARAGVRDSVRLPVAAESPVGTLLWGFLLGESALSRSGALPGGCEVPSRGQGPGSRLGVLLSRHVSCGPSGSSLELWRERRLPTRRRLLYSTVGDITREEWVPSWLFKVIFFLFGKAQRKHLVFTVKGFGLSERDNNCGV